MILRSRALLVAAGLMAMPLAAPMTAARAQQDNPTANMGTNRSMTASPGTADSQAASGVHTGDVGSSSTYGGVATNSTPTNSAATNSTMPGATGRTVVPGSTSTQASASAGTREQKTSGADGGQK